MRVLVTGASGFIGRNLVACLVDKGFIVRASTSRPAELAAYSQLEICHAESIFNESDHEALMQGVDVVIHTAGIAHINKLSTETLKTILKVNFEGTVNLAKAAAKFGVKKFIFLSTIKVNGEESKPGVFFTNVDIPAPAGAYGSSKYEAEKGLIDICSDSEMDYCIIRPPMVYGNKVRGNFSALSRIVSYRMPIPENVLNVNKRSVVSVKNLASLILCCVTSPKANNQVLLIKDNNDLSTLEIIEAICAGKKIKLLRIRLPNIVSNIIVNGLAKNKLYSKLVTNLQADDKYTRQLLDWQPVEDIQEALGARR